MTEKQAIKLNGKKVEMTWHPFPHSVEIKKAVGTLMIDETIVKTYWGGHTIEKTHYDVYVCDGSRAHLIQWNLLKYANCKEIESD